MATKKSTTSTKTKTSKKAAAAPNKRARASKVSTEVTAVKAVARQAKATEASRWRDRLTLTKLLAILSVVYLGLAVAAAVLMSPVSNSLTLTHLTNDALLSQDKTVFVSAARPLFDLELRWALIGLLLLSTVLPVLYLTKLKNFYANRLANSRVLGLRWIDLAVTSALMIEIIALLVGYSDLMTLKLMGGLIGATCALGWLAERANANTDRRLWAPFIVSLVTGALPWVAIGAAKAATLLFGEVRNPWYVYALCVTTLLGFTLLAWNQFNQHRRFRSWANYPVVERNYLLIGAATKIAFAVILIIGLSK